jgi:ABC-type transport system involved in multi-copper enzyme maturation permease subunit
VLRPAADNTFYPRQNRNIVNRILSIARNAFREAIRDRVLYNLVVFVLLLVACAILLGDLTDGQEARTIVNIGLNSMLIFGTFIAIFVGVGLVSKEIEKRTVYNIFSKPVGRGEFVIGKFLGLCLTLLINTIVMGLGVSIALLYVGDRSLTISIWPAVFLIYFELVIITAVAIMFSSFSTPALSALLTFFVFVIGHLSTSLRDLGGGLQSRIAAAVLGTIYYVMPNLALFSFRTEAATGLVPTVPMLGYAVAYSALYCVVLIAVSIMIFSRRNFK